jgi:predicted Zn-dependent protease
MDPIERIAAGETLAELQGIPEEVGAVLLELAEAEVEAGRLAAARTILEGLVVTNHRDAAAWTLLSEVHRRLAQGLAARLCAEVAVHLAPDDPFARLARAESLLCFQEDREEACRALADLSSAGEGVGDRARALAAALGR